MREERVVITMPYGILYRIHGNSGKSKNHGYPPWVGRHIYGNKVFPHPTLRHASKNSVRCYASKNSTQVNGEKNVVWKIVWGKLCLEISGAKFRGQNLP
jgi:hypothetical protein